MNWLRIISSGNQWIQLKLQPGEKYRKIKIILSHVLKSYWSNAITKEHMALQKLRYVVNKSK